MVTQVTLPQVSANVGEETLTAWLRKEGDRVTQGAPLLEVTTDKACVEVDAPSSGLLRAVLAAEKSMLPVGYIVALISDGAEEPLPDVAHANEAIVAALSGTRKGTRHRKRTRRERSERSGVRATPAARRLARELGVDLAGVKPGDGVEVITGERVRQAAGQENEII